MIKGMFFFKQTWFYRSSGMVVGICRMILGLDDAFSLKEKRHVVRSIIDRLKTRFNIAVAEVDMNDKWKNAAIGAVCVSNEAGHADSILAEVVSFVEKDGRAVLVDYTTELIHI